MSISKLVDDHNSTGIALVSIHDRFRPCSRDSSVGRTTNKKNKLSDAATESRACKPTLVWFPARSCNISGTLVVSLLVLCS